LSASKALRLSPGSARTIAREITKAGGREVCFLAQVSPDRWVVEPRAVSRGNKDAVIAAARDFEEGGVMIHNHPSGVLEPSDADLAVASRIFELGLGTAITSNDAGALYVVVEPPPPRVVTPLNLDALEEVLSPSGDLAHVHPRYEDRPGQREMLRDVGGRFNEGGALLVEAGTGTGKSLAYILPAAQWSLQNGERTVISTNTINLQEQLVTKDLPLAQRVLGQDLDWALLKGRRNYVSIRRAYLAAESAPVLFETDRSKEIDALLKWMKTTQDGSTADLSFVPSTELWDEVQSESDVCLRARCPHFQDCFYQRSRRDASRAKLLVVNHHLLFTDLAVRRATENFTQPAVLPAYRHVILDEAHNVEDAATSHLGVEVTRRGLYRALARLDRKGKGVLSALHEGLAGVDSSLRERIEGKIRPALEDARVQLDLFIDTIAGLLQPDAVGAVRIGTEEFPEPFEQETVRERVDGLYWAFRALAGELRHFRERVEEREDTFERLEGRLLDLQSVERRVRDGIEDIRLVLDPKERRDEFVRWIEWKGRPFRGRRNLALAAAPIELGALLRDSLFERAHTVVMSSATLATKGDFSFVRNRLGLTQPELDASEGQLDITESILLSPFDFGRQTILAVATDLPSPNAAGGSFEQETVRVVGEFAEITDGGLFVLFTSHAALRRVSEGLRAQKLRWPVFVQGEDDRARLLEGFVQSGSGVLLGTSSFWEGVDVPGDPLRGLIIQRLPFRVPTEPVTAARVEAIERRGGAPFWDYQLPLAALKLKQGFGRLVRSSEDRGAVVVLDDRLVRMRYGPYLRESLPPAPLIKGPWQELRGGLKRFYSS
jgi:ATP-dependent DNA helicase DinG